MISFSFFPSPQDKEPKGIIPLENIRVREVGADKTNKPNCFEIHSGNHEIIKACKLDSEGKVVEGISTHFLIITFYIYISWPVKVFFVCLLSLSLLQLLLLFL